MRASHAERISRPPATLACLVAFLLLLSIRSLLVQNVASGSTGMSSSSWLALVVRSASLFVVWHRAYVVLLQSAPVAIDLRYMPGSAFESRRITLGGAQRLYTFTVQSWLLEGAYFGVALATSLGLKTAQLSRVLFGVVFATSHLVSSITSWVLIPIALRVSAAEGTKLTENPLFTTNGLVLHNANVVLVHMDMLLVGETVDARCVGAVMLWAIWYILFAWRLARRMRWIPYPFIDYTLPIKIAIPIHLGLVVLLACFFYVGVAFSAAMAYRSIRIRLVAHVLLLLLTTRIAPPVSSRQVSS